MSGLLAAVRVADRKATTPKAAPLPGAEPPVGGSGPGLVPYTTSHAGISVVPSWERIRRLRKRVRWSARSIEATPKAGHVQKPAMLTLTYRDGVEWDAKHIASLMNRCRDYLKRKHDAGLRYVWVAELQTRGAVHYHVLIWLPKGLSLPKPDKQGWWPHGSTRIEWVKNAVRYVTKYATKLEGKDVEFPPGLRIHGSGGLIPKERRLRAYLALPGWLRDQANPQVAYRPVEGGGYVDTETGEIFRSPWILDRFTFRPGVGMVITCRARTESP